MKIKLAILAGGSSFEREISLKSAEEVVKYINDEVYDVRVIEIPKEKGSKWVGEILEFSPDILLNLLHGGDGENGAVSGLLQCLGIKFIGNGVLSGALCMNKHICKAVLKESGVPVCEEVFIKKGEEFIDFEEKIKELGFPVIVKPNNGGGSIGISVAEDISEAKTAVFEIFQKYDDDVIVEKFISGREVTCVVVRNGEGLRVMPVLDISPNGGFYDYNAKYVDNSAKIGFSTLPQFLKDMIEDIAKKVFNICDCRGICCVDFIVCKEQVYFIEVNTIPGFTAKSNVTRTLNELGEDIGEFLDGIIQGELSDKCKKSGFFAD